MRTSSTPAAGGRRTRAAIALLASLGAGAARAAPSIDPSFCDKILEQGIRSHVGDATRHGFRRAVYPSLCARLEQASRDASEASAREAWALVGGEGEYDRARLEKLRTAYCTLATSLQANRPLFEKAAAALDPRALQEWRRCTDASKGKYGPAMEVEQIDEQTLSFTLQPTPYDLRSVKITMDGFDRCSGFIQGPARAKDGSGRFEFPVLARNREHDLACFRKVTRNVPCGTQAAPPASLALELAGAKGARVVHEFRMGRVMSADCAPPP